MNIERIVDRLIENCTIDNYCGEYGEAGYELSEGKQAILFANWNQFDKYPNLMEAIEESYEIEWSDEWVIDYENDKAYRTSPDSYSWEQQVRFTDFGELITPDSDIEEWIEHCEVNEEYPLVENCLPSFIEFDAEENGYKEVDKVYENGWYGREDKPQEIADRLIEEGAKSVLFRLCGVGQFAINFEVYYK